MSTEILTKDVEKAEDMEGDQGKRPKYPKTNSFAAHCGNVYKMLVFLVFLAALVLAVRYVIHLESRVERLEAELESRGREQQTNNEERTIFEETLTEDQMPLEGIWEDTSERHTIVSLEQ
jgi:hypothetical protein